MNNIFEWTHVNLGEIKVGEKIDAVFPYAEDIIIKDLKAECGCTGSLVNSTRRIAVLTFTGKIPNHLKSQGYWEVTLGAKAFCINELSPALTHEVNLSFTVKVVENEKSNS